ncbi:MAG: phosphatidate cytidylyltransferase [Clostridia bacterium]|nr:phosphatidate cytidylyltransferase [Clostridia bacterium]
MKQRVITAILILAVIVPVVFLSEYMVYPIALSLLSLMATFETLRALGVEKKKSIFLPTYPISVALPLFTHDIFLGADAARATDYILICFGVIFVYLLYLMAAAVFSHGELTVSKIGEVFMTVTYIVCSFTAFSLLRYIRGGEVVFLLVFIGAWVSDVGAYFVGYLIGKHKLIPDVSPKKTVEGSIGGIVFSSLVCVIYGFIIGALSTELSPNYVVLAIAGALLSVVSQVGDLIASLIKREHGMKDYSNLLPGHGGIMDRFDSVMAVSVPLLVICLIWAPFS